MNTPPKLDEISAPNTTTSSSFSTNEELTSEELINTPKHSDNMDRLATRTRAAAEFKEIKCETIPVAVNQKKQLSNLIQQALQALRAEQATNEFSIMATTEYNYKPTPRINNKNIRKALQALRADQKSIKKQQQLNDNIPTVIKTYDATNEFSIMATTEYNYKPIPRIHNKNIRQALQALRADQASIKKRKQLNDNIPTSINTDYTANAFSIMAITGYNYKPTPPRSVFLSSVFLKSPESASKEDRKPQSMPIYYKSVVPLSNPKMYI